MTSPIFFDFWLWRTVWARSSEIRNLIHTFSKVSHFTIRKLVFIRRNLNKGLEMDPIIWHIAWHHRRHTLPPSLLQPLFSNFTLRTEVRLKSDLWHILNIVQKNKFLWGNIYLGDLFSKKVTKRRPIWAKSLLWRLSILKGDPFGNTGSESYNAW